MQTRTKKTKKKTKKETGGGDPPTDKSGQSVLGLGRKTPWGHKTMMMMQHSTKDDDATGVLLVREGKHQHGRKDGRRKTMTTTTTTMAVVFAVIVSLFSIAALTRNDGKKEFLTPTMKKQFGNAATRKSNDDDEKTLKEEEEEKKSKNVEQRVFNPLVIIQRDNEKDERDLKRIKTVFPSANSIFGVNAGQWPSHLEDAEYGLAPLRIFNRENFKSKTWKIDNNTRRNPENLKGIQWIESIDQRNPETGKLGDGRMPIAHHIGCMYAHFNAWRAVDDMAYNKGDDKVYPAWIMEADAYVDKNQMKPRMTRLLQKAPKDYDFLMMKRELFLGLCGPDRPGNCKRSENFIRLGEPGANAKTTVPDGFERRIYFYYWPLDGPGAGLSSYAIGPDFSYKAFNFISRKGADMIDGFIFGKLCRDDYVSEDAANPGNFLLPGIGSALVKPRTKEANTKDNKLKVLNCYLIGDVELVKKEDEEKDEASLGNIKEQNSVEKEKDTMTLFKAKVHRETTKSSSEEEEEEEEEKKEEKVTDVSIEASKPTDSSSQIILNAGNSSVTQTVSNNNDGTFSVEVNEKNVDGQGQGETKTEKITINTTQMPGPFGEMFSSVMSTMTNGGSFDLLQQQAQHKKQRQETNAEED